MLTSRELCGLLAEPERRAVVAALVLGSCTISEVGQATGLPLKTVSTALSRLEQAGLVEPAGDEFLLLAEAFKLAARAEQNQSSQDDFPDSTSADERILQQAFTEGRLTHWPAKRTKRLVVLDHIVQRFEPGQRYTERQVNSALAETTDDTAAFRRYLVDEGFLDRADGEYWRSGGTVR